MLSLLIRAHRQFSEEKSLHLEQCLPAQRTRRLEPFKVSRNEVFPGGTGSLDHALGWSEEKDYTTPANRTYFSVQSSNPSCDDSPFVHRTNHNQQFYFHWQLPLWFWCSSVRLSRASKMIFPYCLQVGKVAGVWESDWKHHVFLFFFVAKRMQPFRRRGMHQDSKIFRLTTLWLQAQIYIIIK